MKRFHIHVIFLFIVCLLLFTCELPPTLTIVEVTYPGQFWMVVRDVEAGSVQIIYGEEHLLWTMTRLWRDNPIRMRITVTKTSLAEFVDLGLLVLVAGNLRDEAPFGDSVAELEFWLK